MFRADQRILSALRRIAAPALFGLLSFAPAHAAKAEEKPKILVLDRVAVRWHAPETGGVSKPQFIFERELAFEARIEALSSPDPDTAVYNDRHVRAALDRHIAETLLESLPIRPEPTAEELARRAEATRTALEQRVGGRKRLIEAASAEGIGSGELDALLRREARVSLYVDRMVTPMLLPSDAELRAFQRTLLPPARDLPFETVKAVLQHSYVTQRVTQAIDAYYQNARSRITIVFIRRK